MYFRKRFLFQTVGGFGEVEPLELLRELGNVACVQRLLLDLFQQAARTNCLSRPAAKVAQKKGQFVFPGNFTVGGGVQLGVYVGVAGVPTGEAGVVVGGVDGIPAKHHATEAETAVEGRQKFVAVHHLAAQHAVDVGDRHFDFGGGVVGNFLFDFFGGHGGGE